MRQEKGVSLKRDMRLEGWILEEDTTGMTKEPVEPIPLLKRKETSLPGREVRRRAREIGEPFGQRYAEYVLRQEEKIPVEWREYIFLFPGTLWRDKRGRQRIPSLFWQGSRWALKFMRLDEYFYPSVRFLRCVQTPIAQRHTYSAGIKKK